MKKLKYFLLDLAPEAFLVKRRYKKEFGELPNLNDPKLFTEKLQWLKLHDKNPLKTICSDKLAVRSYIKDIIGEKYLIPLCFYTVDVRDISQSNLPDFPVILKPNHDSGGGIVISDKHNADYSKIRKELDERLSKNYYHFSGEWEYKDIKPTLLVEKLIFDEDKDISLLNDFKIHCFNGKPKYIQTIFDRESNISETWFDTNWNLQDFGYFSKNRANVPLPDNLLIMLDLAEKLSQNFKYVRVDLYDFKGRVYFGELTFHPFCGVMKWEPRSTDLELGGLLNLAG
jgi:hypothetical protein